MLNYISGGVDWDSTGVPNYIKYPVLDPDPYIIFSLAKTFITEENIPPHLLNYPSRRNIIINSTSSSFTGASIQVSFINLITSRTDTVGYCMFHCNNTFPDTPTILDPLTKTVRPITRKDIILDDSLGKSCKNIMNRTILFPVCNKLNPLSYLQRGSTVTLSPILPEFAYNGNVESNLFANNVGIGFFIIPNGWSTIEKNIMNDMITMNHILYANDYLNLYDQTDPNSRFVRENIIMYNTMSTTQNVSSLLINFNDDDAEDGDRDYSDITLQILITPNDFIKESDYFTLPMLTKPSETMFVFDNYGLYYILSVNDYLIMTLAKSVVFKHYIKSSSADYNNQLYDTFNSVYFNESAGTVTNIDILTICISYHTNILHMSNNNRTVYVINMDANSLQPYDDKLYDDDIVHADDAVFTYYAQTDVTGNQVTEHVDIYCDDVLYKQINNSGKFRVDLTHYSKIILT